MCETGACFARAPDHTIYDSSDNRFQYRHGVSISLILYYAPDVRKDILQTRTRDEFGCGEPERESVSYSTDVEINMSLSDKDVLKGMTY